MQVTDKHKLGDKKRKVTKPVVMCRCSCGTFGKLGGTHRCKNKEGRNNVVKFSQKMRIEEPEPEPTDEDEDDEVEDQQSQPAPSSRKSPPPLPARNGSNGQFLRTQHDSEGPSPRLHESREETRRCETVVATPVTTEAATAVEAAREESVREERVRAAAAAAVASATHESDGQGRRGEVNEGNPLLQEDTTQKPRERSSVEAILMEEDGGVFDAALSPIPAMVSPVRSGGATASRPGSARSTGPKSVGQGVPSMPSMPPIASPAAQPRATPLSPGIGLKFQSPNSSLPPQSLQSPLPPPPSDSESVMAGLGSPGFGLDDMVNWDELQGNTDHMFLGM